MAKIIAKLVIDSDEWDDSFPLTDDIHSIVWRHMSTVKAQAFSSLELEESGLLPHEQYYV